MDGVATVVTKLFLMTGAGRAYFGEKDYQQLLIVKRLARDLDIPVEVVPVPTVRDADGLALSSRNAQLSAEHRARAPAIHRRSEEHTSELQSLMRISYAVSCLKKKKKITTRDNITDNKQA